MKMIDDDSEFHDKVEGEAEMAALTQSAETLFQASARSVPSLHLVCQQTTAFVRASEQFIGGWEDVDKLVYCIYICESRERCILNIGKKGSEH